MAQDFGIKKFINLSLFEEVLKYSKHALFNNSYHNKFLFHKTKCIAHLFKFDESIDIFKHIKDGNEV